MSDFDATSLLNRYQEGLAFRRGDVLTPKSGANPHTFDAIEKKVVVLEQSSLAPHKYTVIGERANPQQPSDAFVKFEINGHDWQKIGAAKR